MRASNRDTPQKTLFILPLFACLVWKRLQIGTYMLHIITSTGEGLFGFDLSTSMTLNDLEPPKESFWRIFRDFGLQRIASKWLEIYQDNLHMKFSALNANISNLSCDPLGSRRPAQSGWKTVTSSPKWLFQLFWLVQRENSCRWTETYCSSWQALVTSFLMVSTSMTLNDLELLK